MGIERGQAALEKLMVNRGSSVVKWTRTASYTSDTLEVFEQVLLIDTDTTDGTFTVTLPPVSEAAGKFYSITLIDAGGTVTIQDQDDSYDWTDIDDMDADDDAVLLYSDGLRWFEICDYIA